MCVNLWLGKLGEHIMARALIFLFDGTGNDPSDTIESEATNVFRLNSLISDGRRIGRGWRSQVTFYQPGIGTQFFVRGSFLQKMRQLLFGAALDEMILRAYINLASNYRADDSVLVLGFSRGAIAARVFSRLVTDFGLIKSHNIGLLSNHIGEFYDAIQQPYSDYVSKAAKIKEINNSVIHENLRISFMGLFDCVIGQVDEDFHNFVNRIDVEQSDYIDNYVHLMSLHDTREHFRLCRLKPRSRRGFEVWMPGVHSDVGGGYKEMTISDVSLSTMARQIQRRAKINIEQALLLDIERKADLNLLHGVVAINREPKVGFKRLRKEFIAKSDLFHKLNKSLHGTTVRWKEEGSALYEHRYSKWPIWREY